MAAVLVPQQQRSRGRLQTHRCRAGVLLPVGFLAGKSEFDGSYHSLKVSLKKPVGLTLQARRGYYAPKHEVDAAQEAKREIEEALFSRDEWRDIPWNTYAILQIQ